MKNNWTNVILWGVYLALLAVLLPHTAWAFHKFEPAGNVGTATAWAAAFAFEASIAALTHKLARHIEQAPNSKSMRKRYTKRYLNAYSAGLVIAMLVSGMANLAHAVEFGQPLAVFGRWGVPFALYAVAFGGVLPVVSLLFARVLSNVVESEEANPELVAAKTQIRELRATIRQAEQRAQLAEQRFGAVGDLVIQLFADGKRERILAARQIWPSLPQGSIAIMAESSPGYVSEVLKTK